MADNPWDNSGTKCTMFRIINFAEDGTIRVAKAQVDGVMDKAQIVTYLQDMQPVYEPADPTVDPLFIEAKGYCRLVFAFDKSKPNCLFHGTWPFALKYRGSGLDACIEFDGLTKISRGDMGHTENPCAISAFFIDDRNSVKDPNLIPYNLYVQFSQDASNADAYRTGVTIDPDMGNDGTGGG